jgi:uncharacterized membrane protein YidH (DUF202 family)
MSKLPRLDREMIGLILVILSGIGLLVVAALNFIKPKPKEKKENNETPKT